ncbi:hypothetical protein C4G69_RS01255 [Vibrio parahaemolyticus]|nr:hypothetical protein [Vibrio parahaemolyticus]EJG1033934.1 hypothetical protein [Vibrio parahaemolyticus]
MSKKQEFTSLMIRKSEEKLEQDESIGMEFRMFVNDESMSNLTPQEYASELMYFFQDSNEIRPEILLNRDNDLSQAAFKDKAQYGSFADSLTKYQDDEQALIFNRRNGVSISDKLLDENAVMMYRSPLYEEERDEKRQEKSEKVLDKAYENVQKLKDNGKYVMYSNAEQIISDVQLWDDVQPPFAPLRENPNFEPQPDPNNSVVLGAQGQEFDLLNLATALDDDLDIKEKNKQEVEQVVEELTPAELHAKKIAEKYLNSFDFDEKFMYQDNNRIGNVQTNWKGNVERIELGFEPSAEQVAASLIKLEPNYNISAYPITPRNSENFKEAMRMIRDDNAFDLNDITFKGMKKEERKHFEALLNEVMNEPRVSLGQSLENDDVEQEEKLKAERDLKQKQQDEIEQKQQQVSLGKSVEEITSVDEDDLNGKNIQKAFSDEDIDEQFSGDDLVFDDELNPDDVPDEPESDISYDQYYADVPETFDDELNPDDVPDEPEQSERNSISDNLEDERNELLDELSDETDVSNQPSSKKRNRNASRNSYQP